MKPTSSEVAAAVTTAAGQELAAAADRIRHCVRQLTDEQLWWRPEAALNSIGNLILHVCGNARQWITAGLGGQEDDRDRPGEFSEHVFLPQDALLRALDEAVTEACQVLAGASAEVLLERHRIQGFEVTGMEAMFQSVAHFRGHTQEIVHLTRRQLGDAYKFAFIPTTPEQGAPPAE